MLHATNSFRSRLSNKPRRARRGVVLVIVLVVLSLLVLAVYQYSEMVLAEYKSADSSIRFAQARSLANSGVNYTAALLASPDAFNGTLNGNPYDNATGFSGIAVGSDPSGAQGRFSVIAPLGPDEVPQSAPYRFGVTDEAGKINLNTLMTVDKTGQMAHDFLVTLPNMTEEIANAIVDWMDADDTPRPGGAEEAYYSGLSPPYHCKNGPLDSLEELLLVQGVTPQLLFGNDANRNGILDPEEQAEGALDLGWSAYLTIYSREDNLNAAYKPRIYVNSNNLTQLTDQLTSAVGQDLANFILAYRMYGPAAPGTKPTGGTLTRAQLNLNTSPSKLTQITSLYQLLTASSVTLPNTAPPTRGKRPPPPPTFASPLLNPQAQGTLLVKMLDLLSTQKQLEIPGRINVNTAPRAVLAALPGLASTDVDNIVSSRPSLTNSGPPDPAYETTAWLITQAQLRPAQLQKLERLITARSQVYRFQVIGHFDDGGPTARIEAVIDTNAGQPRILYYRDLTELGKGFDLPQHTN